MLMNLAYAEGMTRAEEDFGLRTASDSFKRGMPRGDMRVHAERLADRLSSMDSEVSADNDPKPKRFGNAVRWGAASSPYGTGSSTYDYSGIGRDGAAI